jgi:hypothetical protein
MTTLLSMALVVLVELSGSLLSPPVVRTFEKEM